MLPTQLLSQTLNTSISLARMQEVNITGFQASIVLNVLREEGKREGEPQKYHGGAKGGMDRGPRARWGPLKGLR